VTRGLAVVAGGVLMLPSDGSLSEVVASDNKCDTAVVPVTFIAPIL